MKRIFIVLLLFLIGILSGCGRTFSYNLAAEGVTEIWIETFPPTLAEGPKHTTDEGTIRDIISYINDLTLKKSDKTGVDLDGMSMQIEISYDNSTKRVFSQLLPYFLEIKEGQTIIYETGKKQKDILGSDIYPKMQTVPVAAGMVEEVQANGYDDTILLVSVFPEYQKIVGGKSVVTVSPNQVYKDSGPYTGIQTGDEVEFFIVGGVRESYPTQSTAYKVNVTSIAAPDGKPIKEVSAPIQEASDPYYVLFRHLFDMDTGLNGSIKYIAVDMSEVKSEDYSDFIALMQAFCESRRLTLLEDTHEGLTEKGLIKDLYFEDGIIISFKDESLTESKFVTSAMKWRSGLGAIGGEYTLEKKNGSWSVTETGAQWIS